MSKKLDFEQAKELIQLGYSLHRRLHRKRGDIYPVYLYWDRKEPLPKGMDKHYELEGWLDDERYNILYEAYKRLRGQKAKPRAEVTWRRPEVTEAEEMEKPEKLEVRPETLPVSLDVSEEEIEELIGKHEELEEIRAESQELEKQLAYEKVRMQLLKRRDERVAELKRLREESKRMERTQLIEWFYDVILEKFPLLVCPKCRVAYKWLMLSDVSTGSGVSPFASEYKRLGVEWVPQCPKCGTVYKFNCPKCKRGYLDVLEIKEMSLFESVEVECDRFCGFSEKLLPFLKRKYEEKFGKPFLERIWNDDDTSAFDIFKEECKKSWRVFEE